MASMPPNLPPARSTRRGERGPRGDHGQDGQPGAAGTTGAAGPEGKAADETKLDELCASFGVVATSLDEYTKSSRDLSNSVLNGQKDVLRSIRVSEKRVRVAVVSNIIGALLLIVAVIGLFHVDQAVNTIRSAQIVNSATATSTHALAQETAQSLSILQRVTGTAATKAQDAHIVALLNQEAACEENHADRDRRALAHLPVPPLRKGCPLK